MKIRVVFWLALAGLAAPLEAALAAGPEVCSACHAAENEQWQGSRHARAFSESFEAYWKEHQQSPSCLACHTTGFDAARGTFDSKGVSCESCHGKLANGHPESAKMFLPVDSELCKQCHQHTFREWQVSRHGQKGIRCFDCHAVHAQGLRQTPPEQLCGACHAQRLEDFAHATHHAAGLTCATCHLPAPRTSGIGGTGAPSHSFFVGSETCASCHEEMVHKSHKISSLTQEVKDLEQTAAASQVERLQAKLRQAELQVDVEKARAVKRLLLAFGLGLVTAAAALALYK